VHLGHLTWSVIAALLLISLPAIALAGGISVSQSIDRSDTPFEEPVQFEIELRWDGAQMSYYFDQPLSPMLDRLKVREFSTTIASTGTGDSEITTKTFSFTLVPTSAGLGSIEAVEISYLSWPDSIPGMLITEPMTVQISHPVPQDATETGLPWWVIGLGCVVIMIMGIIGYRFTHRQSESESPRTASDELLSGLRGLKGEAGSDLKKFQSGLSELLLSFLSREYQIEAADMSDEELTSALENTDLSAGRQKALKQWLNSALKDRYRPVTSSPGDTVRLEQGIRTFFEKFKNSDNTED
jgi:hypothetical protein